MHGKVMKNPSSTFQENIYDTEMPRRAVDLKNLKVIKIVKELIRNNRCKVLDVGCGDGNLLEPFCKSQECYGMDMSEVQLKKAQMRGIRTCRTDLESETLPFADDFFIFHSSLDIALFIVLDDHF